MAVFTDSRGRRYQNDTFREVKDGDVILDATKSFYGHVSKVTENKCTVEWRRYATPDQPYSTGGYPQSSMKRDRIFQEIVRKPLIIICE